MSAPRQNELRVKLTNDEMRAVLELCVATDQTPNGVMLQALRLYQRTNREGRQPEIVEVTDKPGLEGRER